MSARRLAAFAFLIAAAVRIAALSLSDQYVTALKQQVEVRNVAITLARTGDFANPYFVPTGKTAHLAPIAPFLTSLVYRTWGVTDRAEFVRGVVCSLCSALACGLTVLLGFALGLGRFVSASAGLLAALAPHGVQFHADVTELDGCLGTVLLLCALLTLLHAIQSGPSAGHLAAFGVFSGLAILTHNSLLAPLAALAVITAIPVARNPLRLPARSLVLMAAPALLIVLPWSVRNLIVFKQWVTVRSNFGLEFRIAQHDLSPFPATVQVHPCHSARTRALIANVGEPAAFAALGREGMEWIRRRPLEFVLRTLKRIVHFWVPAGSKWRTVLSLLVTLTAFGGYLLLAGRRHPAALVIGLLWLAYPAVYYVLQPLSRYQQPIGFSLYLLTMVFTVDLWNRLSIRKAKRILAEPCAAR